MKQNNCDYVLNMLIAHRASATFQKGVLEVLFDGDTDSCQVPAKFMKILNTATGGTWAMGGSCYL